MSFACANGASARIEVRGVCILPEMGERWKPRGQPRGTIAALLSIDASAPAPGLRPGTRGPGAAFFPEGVKEDAHGNLAKAARKRGTSLVDALLKVKPPPDGANAESVHRPRGTIAMELEAPETWEEQVSYVDEDFEVEEYCEVEEVEDDQGDPADCEVEEGDDGQVDAKDGEEAEEVHQVYEEQHDRPPQRAGGLISSLLSRDDMRRGFEPWHAKEVGEDLAHEVPDDAGLPAAPRLIRLAAPRPVRPCTPVRQFNLRPNWLQVRSPSVNPTFAGIASSVQPRAQRPPTVRPAFVLRFPLRTQGAPPKGAVGEAVSQVYGVLPSPHLGVPLRPGPPARPPPARLLAHGPSPPAMSPPARLLADGGAASGKADAPKLAPLQPVAAQRNRLLAFGKELARSDNEPATPEELLDVDVVKEDAIGEDVDANNEVMDIMDEVMDIMEEEVAMEYAAEEEPEEPVTAVECSDEENMQLDGWDNQEQEWEQDPHHLRENEDQEEHADLDDQNEQEDQAGEEIDEDDIKQEVATAHCVEGEDEEVPEERVVAMQALVLQTRDQDRDRSASASAASAFALGVAVADAHARAKWAPPATPPKGLATRGRTSASSSMQAAGAAASGAARAEDVVGGSADGPERQRTTPSSSGEGSARQIVLPSGDRQPEVPQLATKAEAADERPASFPEVDAIRRLAAPRVQVLEELVAAAVAVGVNQSHGELECPTAVEGPRASGWGRKTMQERHSVSLATVMPGTPPPPPTPRRQAGASSRPSTSNFGYLAPSAPRTPAFLPAAPGSPSFLPAAPGTPAGLGALAPSRAAPGTPAGAPPRTPGGPGAIRAPCTPMLPGGTRPPSTPVGHSAFRQPVTPAGPGAVGAPGVPMLPGGLTRPPLTPVGPIAVGAPGTPMLPGPPMTPAGPRSALQAPGTPMMPGWPTVVNPGTPSFSRWSGTPAPVDSPGTPSFPLFMEATRGGAAPRHVHSGYVAPTASDPLPGTPSGVLGEGVAATAAHSAVPSKTRSGESFLVHGGESPQSQSAPFPQPLHAAPLPSEPAGPRLVASFAGPVSSARLVAGLDAPPGARLVAGFESPVTGARLVASFDAPAERSYAPWFGASTSEVFLRACGSKAPSGSPPPASALSANPLMAPPSRSPTGSEGPRTLGATTPVGGPSQTPRRPQPSDPLPKAGTQSASTPSDGPGTPGVGAASKTPKLPFGPPPTPCAQSASTPRAGPATPGVGTASRTPMRGSVTPSGEPASKKPKLSPRGPARTTGAASASPPAQAPAAIVSRGQASSGRKSRGSLPSMSTTVAVATPPSATEAAPQHLPAQAAATTPAPALTSRSRAKADNWAKGVAAATAALVATNAPEAKPAPSAEAAPEAKIASVAGVVAAAAAALDVKEAKVAKKAKTHTAGKDHKAASAAEVVAAAAAALEAKKPPADKADKAGTASTASTASKAPSAAAVVAATAAALEAKRQPADKADKPGTASTATSAAEVVAAAAAALVAKEARAAKSAAGKPKQAGKTRVAVEDNDMFNDLFDLSTKATKGNKRGRGTASGETEGQVAAERAHVAKARKTLA